jgi:hypothetical protein
LSGCPTRTLTGEQIADEVKRADAVVAVADQIVRNADLQLKAVTILANHGARVGQHLTMLEDRQPPRSRRSNGQLGATSARPRLRRKRPPAAIGPLQGEGRRVKGHPIPTAPRKWRGWKLTA